MLKWRAWYADGRVFSYKDVMWQKLPAKGLVGVVIYETPPYRRIMDGGDWFWLENGDLHVSATHDEWGKWVNPPDVPCKSCVKQGQAMSNEAFEGIQKEMLEATEWP